MKKLLFAFPIIALLAAGCNSAQQTSVQTQNTVNSVPASPAPTNSQLYNNSTYGFSMNYPLDFIVHKGYNGKVFDEITFHLEQGTTLASFIYNGAKYANTNLVGAGMAIGKITPNKEFGCKTVGLGQKTIGNLNFYHGTGGAALASVSTHFDFYEVQGNSGCFEIQMSTLTDASSTKPQLTDQERTDLKNLMDTAALTFKFTK